MTSTEIPNRSMTREQVLALPSADKIKYFKGIIVRHPHMVSALEDVLTLATPDCGSDIIFLIGPSGVGKSETFKTAEQNIILDCKGELESDPSFIPVIVVEAQETGETGFSWRVFYSDIAEKLNEPLIHRKTEPMVKDGRWHVHISARGPTVSALRNAVAKALKNRRTFLLAVDEAVHTMKLSPGRSLKHHMNALKSLSNVSGLTLCLAGSYDIGDFIDLSGQVARRSAIVHMERYRVGNKADEATFLKVLRTLLKHMPLAEPPILDRWSIHLQTVCVGCVGTLKDTLARALVPCLKQGGKWNDRFLERALLSEAAVAKILEETLAGERKLERAIYGRRSLKDLEAA